jgi:hypothetical protein
MRNKVHKFAVIRNEPRELDVIDEAEAEMARELDPVERTFLKEELRQETIILHPNLMLPEDRMASAPCADRAFRLPLAVSVARRVRRPD